MRPERFKAGHFPAPNSRRGIAMVWSLVILALLSVLIGTLIVQVRASRHQLDRRQNRLQADWLARSGVELAAARLLTQPGGYTGESVELIKQSQVRIEVKGDKGSPNMFRVTCQARYPSDSPEAATSSLSRRFHRMSEKGRVRLEVVAADKESGTGTLP